MKKYDKNMKEYEEICQYIGFGTPISIWALGLGKIPRHSFDRRVSFFLHIFFACFVGYEKAFDKVEHARMLEILQKYGINKEHLQIIKNLYLQQKVNVESRNSPYDRDILQY